MRHHIYIHLSTTFYLQLGLFANLDIGQFHTDQDFCNAALVNSLGNINRSENQSILLYDVIYVNFFLITIVHLRHVRYTCRGSDEVNNIVIVTKQ